MPSKTRSTSSQPTRAADAKTDARTRPAAKAAKKSGGAAKKSGDAAVKKSGRAAAKESVERIDPADVEVRPVSPEVYLARDAKRPAPAPAAGYLRGDGATVAGAARRDAELRAAYRAVPEDSPAPAASVYLAEPAAAPETSPLPLTGFDYHLFAEGTHQQLHAVMGAQPLARGGVHFAVWAPNARAVAVIGQWNGWDPRVDPLQPHPSGVWSGVVPGARPGMTYKYRVVGMRGEEGDKADPFALAAEEPPKTASIVADLRHDWGDAAWMAGRARRQSPDAPIAIYEVHLGSWQRGEGGRFLSYVEVAERLIAHVRALGFTHVEFLPLTEHPFYGSWGYQTVAYYAPTARYGRPQELMALIDRLHQADIGVILDWVPAHFPADGHGLAYFDGTHLFEHADPRRGLHPDWNTLIFNLARNEVRAFLISAALLWIERYHVDGLRVDAVASMLYRNYSRRPGEWEPNEYGGCEDLEAVAFLRQFNHALHTRCPGVITIAEESTSWPRVTEAVARGGLGFDYKWDMGWMHDTLRYLHRDPIARQHHHSELNFRMMYAYNERYVLPLSHDEVVHCKGSLAAKMHGDLPARFASLRLLYAYMFGMPGKKLLFMGDEFGQLREWNHDRGLDWHLREGAPHGGLERWLSRLGHLHRERPALHALDHDPAGFQWLVVDDNQRSVAVFVRKAASGPVLLFALNFTPVTWSELRVGVPNLGAYTLLLRSDAPLYAGGEGMTELPGEYVAAALPAHGKQCSIGLTLPPLTALVLEGPDVAEFTASHRKPGLDAPDLEVEPGPPPPSPPPAPASASPKGKTTGGRRRGR
jgi:1,4-alpha-glucan branching enzyme